MKMELDQLYQLREMQTPRDIPARIHFLTHLFLGKPYITNPQGEGQSGEFDQAPLYRFDGFDCVTFVNNILALAFSSNPDEFQNNLLKVNYYDSKPIFENRFHFMSADWNPENQKNNIVADVTENIVDDSKNPIAIYAEGEIDKPNWFLKRIGKRMHSTQFIRMPYLPLTKLFDKNKNPAKNIFDQIPDVSVVEIVRPNWNLRDKIGTNLHVSHVGFALRQPNGELLFRHATSEKKCVVELLLSDYLKNVLESETIKGINVQRVVTP